MHRSILIASLAFWTQLGFGSCSAFVRAMGPLFFPELPVPAGFQFQKDSPAQLFYAGRDSARTRNSVEETFLDSLTPYQRWEALSNLDLRLRLFDPGYQLLLEETDRHLPQSGLIADLGCGDGGASCYLTFRARERRLIFVDESPNAIRTTRERLALLPPDPGAKTSTELRANFLRLAFTPDSLDGVVLMNAFVYVPPHEKYPFLQRLYPALKPGAQIVIQDPIPFLFPDYDEFVIEKAEQAISRGAVFTPWELRLLGAMHQLNLDTGEQTFHPPHFTDPQVLEREAKRIGFSEIRVTPRATVEQIEFVLTK